MLSRLRPGFQAGPQLQALRLLSPCQLFLGDTLCDTRQRVSAGWDGRALELVGTCSHRQPKGRMPKVGGLALQVKGCRNGMMSPRMTLPQVSSVSSSASTAPSFVSRSVSRFEPTRKAQRPRLKTRGGR